MLGGVRVSGMYLAAGRECRYSGARWGIGAFGLLGLYGALGLLRGVRGVLGADRECRYSGARRGIGGIWGLLVGVRGHWGGKWTGSPTTLGPSPGSQHSHWFPLGSDLPHQGQARAPAEGPITPTGFPWGVTYLAKAKQVT